MAEVIGFKINPDWDGENAELLTSIGYAFEKGTVFEQNYVAAIYFYTLAADNDDPEAINNLGWMHENGLGFKKDVRYAVDLYKDAAKLCCSTAMVNLGNVYERGVLTGQPDYDSAFMWYELAAKYGNLKGKFNHAT